MKRRGILLAGGEGSRLYPLTKVQSKQLLPVYDKPLVYYPLTTLMLAGIRDICLISTPRDLPHFEQLLGTGNQWGINITYRIQDRPRGIAEAFLIAGDFLNGEPSALILGDNLFYGHGLTELLGRVGDRRERSTIFGYMVKDPERYGVIELNKKGQPVRLVEKPTTWISPWAVTGLYFYDGSVSDLVSTLEPSARGELEITDLNQKYLDLGLLDVELLYRGFAWLDTGTPPALHQAAAFVQTIQERQGIQIASPEEVAYRMGFIDKEKLVALANVLPVGEYATYLRHVALE